MPKTRILHFGAHAASIPVVDLDSGKDVADLDEYVEAATQSGYAPLVVTVDSAGTTEKLAVKVGANWRTVETLEAPG